MTGLGRRLELLEREVRRREEDLNRPVRKIFMVTQLHDQPACPLGDYLELEEHTDPQTWADAVAAVELADPFARAEREAVQACSPGGLAIIGWSVPREGGGWNDEEREGYEYLKLLLTALRERGCASEVRLPECELALIEAGGLDAERIRAEYLKRSREVNEEDGIRR